MNASLVDGAWIAVQVRPGCEESVAQNLRQRGYEEFLPHGKRSGNSGASRRHSHPPLFPGYVFCQYLTAPSWRIVEIPWVIKLVGAGGQPLAIPDYEIDCIRELENAGVYAEECDFVDIGDSVVLTCGPLRGVEGTVVSTKKGLRLILSVSILQRSVAVEVSSRDIAPRSRVA